MRRALTVLLLLLAAIAAAADTDPRGWTRGGQVAANTARVLNGPGQDVAIDLPKDLARTIDGPTLLVVFAPLCPHCRHVAGELVKLSERTRGTLEVVGVATSGATRGQIAEFAQTFDVTFRIVHDADGAVARALGARATPSAVLVEPHGRSFRVRDAFFPYAPGQDVLVEMRAAPDPWQVFTPGRFLGNQACAACHVEEATAWQLTHHSVAWRTLERHGRTDDPACTGCHVTGAGQPGGWDGSARSQLVDVGCEACHGPGGPHDGTPTDARATCVGCHDAKHAIDFSVDKGLPLVDHFAAVGLAADAIAARRRALLDGAAPRDLLAFGPAPLVGSAACAGCHEAEHAWWKASRHAGAMKSLSGAAARDPDCVRCHASPAVAGIEPADLEGYRTEEGIGCESCHGPGGAHVAAGGGADTIQGLGESCPVCVLETLCTSCHTRRWDPDWNLEHRLHQVRHGARAP